MSGDATRVAHVDRPGASFHRRIVAVGADRSGIVCVALMALASLGSLLLRARVPMAPTSLRQYYDQGLFLRGAIGLEHGNWLGSYDRVTLSKGPAYPAFIAAMHWLGVPLKIGEQLTWLLAALCVAGCVWMITRRRVVAVAVYVVLAMDPISFDSVNAGVLRDGWYASLSLLFLASFFLAVFAAVNRARLVVVVAAGLLCGISGATFWLCREEGAWIVPSLALIGVGLPLWAGLRWWRRTGAPERSRRAVLLGGGRVAIALLVVGAAFVAPLSFVKAENKKVYGVALTNDLTQGEFARVYADWSRVNAGPRPRYVPISRAQREAVYRISPAARRMEPYLENPHNGWIRWGCVQLKICDDFAGGWTAWALRDAAGNAKHIGSAADLQTYFGQISRDIQAGCSNGALSCRARLPVSLQPLQSVLVGPLAGSVARQFADVIWSDKLAGLPTTVVRLSDANWVVYHGAVSGSPADQAAFNRQLRAYRAHLWPYHVLMDLYKVLVPLMLVLALVAAGIGMVRRPRWPLGALWVLGASLATGALLRAAVLGVIDSTQYHIGGRYEIVLRALVLTIGVIGSTVLAQATYDWLRPVRPTETDELSGARNTDPLGPGDRSLATV